MMLASLGRGSLLALRGLFAAAFLSFPSAILSLLSGSSPEDLYRSFLFSFPEDGHAAACADMGLQAAHQDLLPFPWDHAGALAITHLGAAYPAAHQGSSPAGAAVAAVAASAAVAAVAAVDAPDAP